MTTSLMLFTSPHHTIQGTSGGVWTRSHTYRHRSCEKPPVFSLCRVMWAQATYQPTSIHELLPTVHPYVDLLCGVFRKREVYLMELYVWLQGWRQRRHTEPQRQCPKDKLSPIREHVFVLLTDVEKTQWKQEKRQYWSLCSFTALSCQFNTSTTPGLESRR